jgi:hypothetical protein
MKSYQTSTKLLSSATFPNGGSVLTDVVEKEVLEQSGFGIENEPPEMKGSASFGRKPFG